MGSKKWTAALALGFVMLNGCATVPSEYNQGCRDGVADFVSIVHPDEQEYLNTSGGCDDLEARRPKSTPQREPHTK